MQFAYKAWAPYASTAGLVERQNIFSWKNTPRGTTDLMSGFLLPERCDKIENRLTLLSRTITFAHRNAAAIAEKCSSQTRSNDDRDETPVDMRKTVDITVFN